MAARRGRVALLAVLLLAMVVLGIRAARRWAGYRGVEAACSGLATGDWQGVLAATADLVGTDPDGLRAADCRCLALAETDRRGECTTMLEGLLADPATEGWLPAPVLSGILVLDRQERGDLAAAADLAHRAATRYPEEPLLLELELAVRVRIEGEEPVLDEMARRLPTLGSVQPLARVALGERFLAREEWARAREVLGERPPADPSLRDRWYMILIGSHAGEGRLDEVMAADRAWRQAGADPAVADAFLPFQLSIYNLFPREGTLEELFRKALGGAEALAKADPRLLEAVYGRFIGHLAIEGRHEEALALQEEAEQRLPGSHFYSREELLRSATWAALGERGLEAVGGTLRFVVAEREPGDVLLISPDADRPIDTPFVEATVPASGVVSVERAVGVAPQRWVLRDREGGVRGSGTIWPNPGETVSVEVARAAAASLPHRSEATPRPADGRRRVYVVILDCGDWRLVNYGRARGELPTLDRLATAGTRAVLDSHPPYTAVAIRTLLHPAQEGLGSFVSLVYQMGLELAGNNFVGANPAEGLKWILPGETDLFHELAARGVEGVNLLRSRGAIQAGRNAVVIGPRGEREIAGFVGWRPLGPEELAILGRDRLEGQEKLVEEVAGDFDTVVGLAREPQADYVLLRVAALDLLTHGFYAETVRSGQDDGSSFLFAAYRYVDRRLAELWSAIDADDVLVVMSDHGIRTAMEHDRHAMFVAAGDAVPTGRIAGTPELRGIGRMLGDLFGVDLGWPATGIEAWVQGSPRDPAPTAGG